MQLGLIYFISLLQEKPGDLCTLEIIQTSNMKSVV